MSGPLPSRSDEGERKTGIVWSYRRESEQMFHGEFDNRHEAIGHAAIVGRIMDEKTDVRWHESMWRELDEPTVCGYCNNETHYAPLVNWTFATGVEASPFCSTECWARYQYENPEKVPGHGE